MSQKEAEALLSMGSRESGSPSWLSKDSTEAPSRSLRMRSVRAFLDGEAHAAEDRDCALEDLRERMKMADVMASAGQRGVDGRTCPGGFGFEFFLFSRERRRKRVLHFIGKFADARFFFLRQLAEFFEQTGHRALPSDVLRFELRERLEVGAGRHRGFRFRTDGLKMMFEFGHVTADTVAKPRVTSKPNIGRKHSPRSSRRTQRTTTPKLRGLRGKMNAFTAAKTFRGYKNGCTAASTCSTVTKLMHSIFGVWVHLGFMQGEHGMSERKTTCRLP